MAEEKRITDQELRELAERINAAAKEVWELEHTVFALPREETLGLAIYKSVKEDVQKLKHHADALDLWLGG